jgi:hypothetical protein
LKIGWYAGVLHNGLYRTLGLARPAVDTLVGVNHEHSLIVISLRIALKTLVILTFLDVVEAIDWANLNARTILCSETV